jgi:hypothetical protein
MNPAKPPMEYPQMTDQPVREVARCGDDFDLIREDHGCSMVTGTFHYVSSSQGLGRIGLTTEWCLRLQAAVGAEGFRNMRGKACWVTHTSSKIMKIEPLLPGEGVAFDMEEWSEAHSPVTADEVSKITGLSVAMVDHLLKSFDLTRKETAR